jgi:hypothetical protein
MVLKNSEAIKPSTVFHSFHPPFKTDSEKPQIGLMPSPSNPLKVESLVFILGVRWR